MTLRRVALVALGAAAVVLGAAFVGVAMDVRRPDGGPCPEGGPHGSARVRRGPLTLVPIGANPASNPR